MPEQEPRVIETQNENNILHNLRVLGVAGLASGVALFGASRVESAFAGDQAPKANTANHHNDEWPPIDQEIDGKEFNGNVQLEQNIADECKNTKGTYRIKNLTARITKSQDDDAKVGYSLAGIPTCNGYGQSTVKISVLTNRAGQSKTRSSDSFTVRSHKTKRGSNIVELAHPCGSAPLIGRVVAKVSYKHMDGSTRRRTVKSEKTQLC